MTGEDGKKNFKSNSTVSRYACRIQCERKPPYSARLYAAAFDVHGRIQLSVSLWVNVKCVCWCGSLIQKSQLSCGYF